MLILVALESRQDGRYPFQIVRAKELLFSNPLLEGHRILGDDVYNYMVIEATDIMDFSFFSMELVPNEETIKGKLCDEEYSLLLDILFDLPSVVDLSGDKQ